jgi:hypothetical protein
MYACILLMTLALERSFAVLAPDHSFISIQHHAGPVEAVMKAVLSELMYQAQNGLQLLTERMHEGANRMLEEGQRASAKKGMYCGRHTFLAAMLGAV